MGDGAALRKQSNIFEISSIKRGRISVKPGGTAGVTIILSQHQVWDRFFVSCPENSSEQISRRT
jgi:hypothetical protein